MKQNENCKKCYFCSGEDKLYAYKNNRTVGAEIHSLDIRQKDGGRISFKCGFDTPTHGVIDQCCYFMFKFCPECGKDLREYELC